MNIQPILLVSITGSIVSMAIHIYIWEKRLNALNYKINILHERVMETDDSLFGIRTVAIESLEGEISKLKKEIEEIKKRLKHSSDSSGNGHTA